MKHYNTVANVYFEVISIRWGSSPSRLTNNKNNNIMKINCPKCHKETEFFLSDAVDEHGEVFKCQHCGFYFRYATR